MEAKTFLRELVRMCDVCNCRNGECPIFEYCHAYNGFIHVFPKETIDTIVETTEQWSKENPVITNRTKFLEIFGSPFDTHDITWWDRPYKKPNL